MHSIISDFNNLQWFGIAFIDLPSMIILISRFILNFLVVGFIVKYIYLPNTKKPEFVFPYFLISTSIFLLIFMLGAVKIKIGIALGLFAVFGIIRYRTDSIPIKQMTYLFTIIALSVINGMVSNKISYVEILITNFIVITVIAFIERTWEKNKVLTKNVRLERIDVISPDKRQDLKMLLEKRMGIEIQEIEIGDVDYLNDTTKIKLYYNEK